MGASIAAIAGNIAPLITVAIVIVVLIFLGIFFYFLKVWIRAMAAGAHVSLFNLVGMKLRGIKPVTIVDAKIMATKAGLTVSTNDMEAHYLAGGAVTKVIRALIAADKANIELSFKKACAIDLEGYPPGGRDQCQPPGDRLPRPGEGEDLHRRGGDGRDPVDGQGPGHHPCQSRPVGRRGDR